jgi:hypothetical protein
MTDIITLNQSQQQKFDALNLTIELVPQSCWCNNLRSMLKRSQWDILRHKVYQEANHKCEICQGVGPNHPVECHEVWDYSDELNIQKLTKLISICPQCHFVKHIGLTYMRGKEYGDIAYKRFHDINELTGQEAKLFYGLYRQQWQQRSVKDWKLDVSLLFQYDIDIVQTKFKELDRKLFVHDL